MTYLILWRFVAKPETIAEFERAYGERGLWVDFFRQGRGYLRTELLRNVDRPREYMTCDYWQTEEDFRAFRREHRAEYDRLDRECERLTVEETSVGAFETGKGNR